MNDNTFNVRERGINATSNAAILVAGYNGRIKNLETAATTLVENGFNVFAYEFNPDVLNSGDANDLPTAIQEVTDDFRARTFGYHTIQPAGVSMGAGFAWATQKRSETELDTEQIILPGIYAAAGANSADGIFVKPINPIMYTVVRNIRKAFENSGYDHESLREAWHQIHEPPKSGFVVALGGLDYVVRYREIMRSIDRWKSYGIPIATIVRKFKAHDGTIDWFNKNTPAMLEAIHSLHQ